MKHLLFLLVICFFIVSCSSHDDHELDAKNLALIDQYVKAVESNDPKTMAGLLADNYMGYGPSVADSINKQGAIASWKWNMDSLYQSIEYTRQQSIAVSVKEGETMGDWVSNWAYLTIKYKDGRGPVHLWVNAAYKIEDGKIVRSRTFYNVAHVMQQLGYEMVPVE